MEPNLPQTGPNRKLLLIGAGAAVLVIIIAIVAFATTRPTANPSASSTPNPSGTIAPTPTPSDAAKAPAVPLYENFSALLDNGLSDDQLSAVKYAFVKYAKASGKTITQVSLDPNSLATKLHTSGHPADTTTFIGTINSKDGYEANVEATNLTAARLYLTDSKTGAVYDSGLIDLYNGVGN